jgi:hypothetical protein
MGAMDRLAAVAQHVSARGAPAAAPTAAGAAAAPTAGGAAAAEGGHDDAAGAHRVVRHELLTADQWQHYSEHGYVNIGGILSGDLTRRLTEAAVRIRKRVRDGSLYHGFIHRTGIEAAGFPTGPEGGLGEPWLARGIFSPQHAEPVFAEYLGHPQLMRYCADFLGCASSDELLLSDTSLLISPRDADFSVGWHFDYDTLHRDRAEPVSVAEWQASEHTPARRGMLQFNCTLAPPNMFALLPGSHRRPLAAGERATLWQSRGGSVPADTAPADWSPPLPSSSGSTTPECESGVFTFWDGGCLHHGDIMKADSAERLQLHNLIRSEPLPSAGGAGIGNWNVLPGSRSTAGRHMNPQDYWVAAPNVRENLPSGSYARAAYDRWYAQLGELPPEISGRGEGSNDLAQYDYAEAASYWGDSRPPHSIRYHPTEPAESQFLDPETGAICCATSGLPTVVPSTRPRTTYT